MGDPPTPFETELLAVADQSETWVTVGQRIGAVALFMLLDELGGEKVHIPTRATFQQRLYRPVRDAELRALHHHFAMSKTELSRRTGICVGRISEIVSRPGGTHEDEHEQ